MTKYRVSFYYDQEFEAEDMADALMQADLDFNIMSDARVDFVEDDGGEQ